MAKKKIKDLTSYEQSQICLNSQKLSHMICGGCEVCPLAFKGKCINEFVEKLRYIEKEVEVDD